MTQEKYPAAKPAPAIVVEKYDPRQAPLGTSPLGTNPAASPVPPADTAKPAAPKAATQPVEIGGPSGPEPTRYGDWERNGRVSDF